MTHNRSPQPLERLARHAPMTADGGPWSAARGRLRRLHPLAALLSVLVLVVQPMALQAQSQTERLYLAMVNRNNRPLPVLSDLDIPKTSNTSRCDPFSRQVGLTGQFDLSPGRTWVDNTIVLTGRLADIASLARSELGVTKPITTPISLGYLNEFSQNTGDSGAIRTLGRYSGLSLALYSTGTDPNGNPRRPDDAVARILRQSLLLYQNGQLQTPVFADLNYVTGYPQIVGNPWGIEGSPWGIEGSPWGIEGSPWGIEGSPLEGTDAEKLAVYQTVAERAFITQWPITGPRGIGIYRPNYTRALPATADGTGTLVALFDTAPYTTAGLQVETRRRVRVPICVHLLPQPALNAPKDPTGYMRDHGLFGAGLAWIAAPQSQLHLIRVLDDNAVGDMYTLVAGINGFTESTLPRNGGLLRNVVYNFSLGIKPNAAAVPAEIAQLNQEIISLMPPDERPQLVNGLPVTALEIPINTAYLFGAVLVASAGNDSATLPAPAPANAPAAFRQVTGVFSTNLAMGQSCYSNAGDVGAPGGDGGVRPGDCQPLMDQCKASSACDYGVVSLVSAQPMTVGYAYWVGTSFAAPLASGVAAAALEAGVSPFNMEQKLIDSTLTRGVIDAVTTVKP